MADGDVEEAGRVGRLRDAHQVGDGAAFCSHGIETRTDSACTGSCIP